MVTIDDGYALALQQSYLALAHPRDLKELAREVGVPLPTLRSLARKNHWTERATEYDQRVTAEAERRDISQRVEEWAERRKEHLLIARLARQKALEYLRSHEVEGLEDGEGRVLVYGMDPNKAKIMMDLLKYADTTERLDLGEPTERHALQGQDGDMALSIESVQLQVQRAVARRDAWRSAQRLPAIDDEDILGDFVLSPAPLGVVDPRAEEEGEVGRQ